MIKRHILTGTPGAGKTALIRLLEINGQTVVEEAATDIIALEQAQSVAEPWIEPAAFIEKIVVLQKQRQLHADALNAGIQFFDRSPLCTYALSVYLNINPPPVLLEEIERIKAGAIYQQKVFFIENLGFCTPSEARKISFEESLRFEKIHKDAYAEHGYECIKIKPLSVAERVDTIMGLV